MDAHDDNLNAATAWLEAIASRRYHSARQVVRSDLDVNIRGAGGVTALHVLAALEGDTLAKIERLLNDGADVSATNDRGETPLMIAQYHVREDTVRLFLYHEELVRALGAKLGRPPTLEEIHTAVRNKKMRGFRDDVKRHLESDTTTLITAARTGDLDTVRLMLERQQIPVNVVDAITNETPFSAALVRGRRRMCEYLLANGAHTHGPCVVLVDRQMTLKSSTLVTAVRTGDVDLVRRLVAHGARRSPSKYDRLTCPLAEAVILGSSHMIDALLGLGFRFASDRTTQTLPWPACHAFQSDDDDHTPWSLLAMACWQQDTAIIDHLFSTHAVLRDREKMKTRGASALVLAAYHDNLELASELLARGVCVNAPVDQALTAVVAAVSINSVRMLRFFLDRGADTDALTGWMRSYPYSFEARPLSRASLLSIAVAVDAIECAHVLLPLETRPIQRDRALQQAIACKNHKFVRVMLEIALPSTLPAFRKCIETPSCPLILDELLTRCCAERYPIATLRDVISWSWRYHKADSVAVFLAHGCKIEVDAMEKMLIAEVQTWDRVRAYMIKFALENGADPCCVNGTGASALNLVESRLQNNKLWASNRVELEICRDLLTRAGAK